MGSHFNAAWLVLAGFGAGLIGSIAGLASLFSYPALLAFGLPPVNANVTNTVALVFNSVGSVWGSRPEYSGQRASITRLLPIAVFGGICGGVLLLVTPPGAFSKVVPVLIGLASLAILARPRPLPTDEQSSPVAHPRLLTRGVFIVGLYGGYFGAAAGVLLLALLLRVSHESLARSNALKNLLLGFANGVAAIAFAAFGPVDWTAVLPLAIGCLIGGRIGPIIVRKTPTKILRPFIALAGLFLAVRLGYKAY